MQQTLGSLTEQLENSKKQLGTPFPHEEELAVKKKRLAELTAILESAADDDTVKSVSSEINEIVDPYFMEVGSENDLQKLKDSGILFEKRESEGHIIVRMNRSDSDKAHICIQKKVLSEADTYSLGREDSVIICQDICRNEWESENSEK